MTEFRQNPEVFPSIESIVQKGMFYNPFQHTITYQDETRPVPPLVFGLLLCLEYCAVPFGDCEEVQCRCWLNGCSPGNFKKAVSKTDGILRDLRVLPTVFQGPQ